MAVPTYATDLQSFGANVTTTTGWSEPSGYTSTDGTGEVDTDLSIYGTSCYTEAQRKSGSGGLFYTTTEPGDFADGTDCIFGWYKFFASNAVGVKGANGINMLVGSSSSNFNEYYVAGSDTYAYGGWRNYVVNPNTTAVTPSATVGSPNGTHNGAGFGVTLSYGISKGNSHNLDIIRYGRGQLSVINGQAGSYGVFSGMATANDSPTTGRWGLFQDNYGSYLWKGLISLGLSGTAVDFRDANAVIVIDDTEFVQASFNRIEINNASSNVEWTAVNISALGTVSKGEFEVVDNATVSLDTCTFTDMSTFVFLSNSTIDNCIFRRCGQVTNNSAPLTACTFDRSTATAALLASDLDDISDCIFISDGTGHAVNLGNVTTTASMGWNANDSGYAATNGSTGNETILVNVSSGQTLTINVGAGYTTPTVKNDGTGTVNVVSGQVTLTLTGLKVNTEVRIYSAGTQTELTGVENSGTSFAYTYTYVPSTEIDIVVHNISYQYIKLTNVLLGSGDASLPIQQIPDRWYDNP